MFLTGHFPIEMRAGSTVVSISAFHADDPGSSPGPRIGLDRHRRAKLRGSHR